ncbi:hypothetical protein CJ203_09940 [Corynebacterium tuscaniense]|uniref:Uncharacterized protein n=2 Tax=Corynebacterium tuscaniense TaxID=302449 RepID=A0A2N6T2Q5_9CORY|nr:hypothetical protein [Corynebacterium tuscaniense]PMC63629.1 hypothetical protein CJ203_09940 [Corynebacterium tuscaniense]
MRKAKAIAMVLAATALMVAGCSGSDEQGEGEQNTTQNSAARSDADTSDTQDQADPGACTTEVSIKALLDEMPDELVGLPYDPDYSTMMDEG